MELQKLGQSIWYDNIRRALLTSGGLKKLIDEDGLRGMTSNPTIFEKAIAGSTDYNDQLQQLALQGKKAVEIYEDLAIQDIQTAADIFHPVFERTKGLDGYVSLEVSPHLGRDTAATISEAKRLWGRVDRRNVMIKVPGTPEGIPAIEELVAEGLNINITLIFSNDLYKKVCMAYIAGLERRVAGGKPIFGTASVASFFVSRIDTAVDNQLEDRIRNATNDQEKAKLNSLLGKVAIANAKIAYQLFKEIFYGDRFKDLKDKGARVQRPLWASTGTKNPKYSDVYYVESLIGSDTVDTVPPATFDAFRDHGKPALTLETDLDGARQTLKSLADSGIDLNAVTTQLLEDGLRLFNEPYEKLMSTIDEKRETVISIVERQTISLGKYQPSVQNAIQTMEQQQYVQRLWKKDPTLWKNDPEDQKIIRNSLGWLTVAQSLLENSDDLAAFAQSVKKEGYQYAVVLGMGGSSLCPEVFARSFGKIGDYPKLLVLDSTDPVTVKRIEDSVDIARTLFIVSSKSGTTTEPQVFMDYFFDKVSQVKPDRPGSNFVAITDPGTVLEQQGHEKQFRRVFLNQPDIGGRYSALSYFGMVPAAVMGLDVKELLERAVRADQACDGVVPTDKNPGARLGAVMGQLAKEGRDKVTFVTPPPIDSLGLWIEQLIAESTGKEGRGILPVSGETLGTPDQYGTDRIFAYVRTNDTNAKDTEAKLTALEKAGHPIVQQVMRDPVSLGREFFLWEIATALAGALIGINAFNQPNVQESKDNTKQLLQYYDKEGKLPEQEMLADSNECAIYCDALTKKTLDQSVQNRGGSNSIAAYVGAHLARVKPGDYVAFTAYIPESATQDNLLQQMRTYVRDHLKVATTVGYGPRFLHSTGQFHKGGPDTGVFIQITTENPIDLKIPGQKFTFGILKHAQALGDFQSLSNRHRRAIRFHIKKDVASGLKTLLSAIQDTVK